MKILIVEDNIILCGMIEKWLQKAGYEVLAAIDEPGARNILKKNEINLVLGDVRLPEGDGISLLEWMMPVSRMQSVLSNSALRIICKSLFIKS